MEKEIENGAVPEVTIEQIKNVFLDCNKAADSYLQATDEAKCRTLEKLLSNAIIANKTVAKYSFKSPYQLVANIPKNATISQMLGHEHDIRTMTRKDLRIITSMITFFEKRASCGCEDCREEFFDAEARAKRLRRRRRWNGLPEIDQKCVFRRRVGTSHRTK